MMAEAYLRRLQFEHDGQAAAVARVLGGMAPGAGQGAGMPKQVKKRVQKDPMSYAMVID